MLITVFLGAIGAERGFFRGFAGLFCALRPAGGGFAGGGGKGKIFSLRKFELSLT